MTLKEFWASLLSDGTDNGSNAAPEANGVIKDDNNSKLKELFDLLKDRGIIPDTNKNSEEESKPAAEEKKTVDTSKIVIGGLVGVIVIMLLILILKRR